MIQVGLHSGICISIEVCASVLFEVINAVRGIAYERLLLSLRRVTLEQAVYRQKALDGRVACMAERDARRSLRPVKSSRRRRCRHRSSFA